MSSSCLFNSGDGIIKTSESVCKVNDELFEVNNGLTLHIQKGFLNLWVEIKIGCVIGEGGKLATEVIEEALKIFND